MCARYAPIATGPLADVRVLDTRVMAPPRRASSYYKAPPAHSVRLARAAVGETACGDPAHHRLSSNRVAPAHPMHRASPRTAPAACDSAPPVARGMPGVVAHRVPTPQARTNGSRARHGRGGRHTP